MSLTKAEAYKSIVKIQRETGQGFPGIAKVMGTDSGKWCQYLDELIEEGLVVANDTGGSLGHPESNMFYTPSKGYNVWTDEGTDGEYSRHKGKYLHFVRFYLGILDVKYDEDMDEDTRNKKNWLAPSMTFFLRNPEVMKSYTEWLERNQVALEEMLALDDFYDAPTIEFSKKETEWIKSRGWYEKNKLVSECLELSLSAVGENRKLKSTIKELISLYKRSGDSKYDKDLEEAQQKLDGYDNEDLTRKKLNKWLETLDNVKSIQECI